ncbi:MAG: CYTH domain-containing protein [Calditrichaeota bacterium]|nr:MAG: CYTH domain-containing protein [Calditrichota bacterium]
MGIEIERKYLLKNNTWRANAIGTVYRQGYLSTNQKRIVRVRVVGNKGLLTIKGETDGVTRSEFEYEIPLEDANSLLENLCKKPLIEKVRYHVEYAGLTWEIDEFQGENAGLIIAEVELQEENQTIIFPDWIGEEVSADPRYYNSNLVINPFTKW